MSLRTNSTKTYLTPNEVAELLMVSPVTVRSWAQKGLLVAKVTPGGHRRFLKSDVERFARESGVTQDDARQSVTRVLIADGDLSMTAYIRGILENSGIDFMIETAQNGFEAGVKVHNFAPSVVLLNVMSPEMDGFRICSLIKGDAETRNICVIAVTEKMGAENLTRIQKAGAETFLATPFSAQDLLGILSHTAGIKKVMEGERKSLDTESDDAETLHSFLTHLAESKDCARGHHDSVRLTKLADVFGRSLGRLSPEDLQALRNACTLHDIGNLGIPDSILLKPEALTEEEWTIMRSHTLIGAQLCSGLKDMALTVPIIRSHHERWNGSGYPDGLKGEAIPYLARVFQLVDIFDTLSSPRPYKPALPFEEVMGIIRQEIANGWLDPDLGSAFLELLSSEISSVVGY
ncbi:MAG: HD domain-containing phosphohydrolase [Gammaproteobacteria bacterium]